MFSLMRDLLSSLSSFRVIFFLSFFLLFSSLVYDLYFFSLSLFLSIYIFCHAVASSDALFGVRDNPAEEQYIETNIYK